MNITPFAVRDARTAICFNGLAMAIDCQGQLRIMKIVLASLKKTEADTQFGLAKGGFASL